MTTFKKLPAQDPWRNGCAFGCLTWMAIGAALTALFFIGGCAQMPAGPDPYSPWYGIPHPIKCGPHCEGWVEPGMMVKP